MTLDVGPPTLSRLMYIYGCSLMATLVWTNIMCLYQDNILVTGGEDSVVRAWDTRSGKEAWSVAHAHTNRIRGVAMMGSSLETNDDSNGLSQLVASASSDGTVKVWDPRMVGSEEGAIPVPLMEAETKARLTCLVGCGVSKSEFFLLFLSFFYEAVP